MVSDKKVFPTKDSWVSLERQPIIPDSKELEKVFKHHNICLLSLPPPDKRAPPRSKSGNNGASFSSTSRWTRLLTTRGPETRLD